MRIIAPLKHLNELHMLKNDMPKILSNIPEGKDLLKAESHQKISNTIIDIIENQSSIIDKQIIGLEGSWGTGKSNIIKIIEENTKEKYYHFTYDTWTHQEDLTRKSILQGLINFLKNDSIKLINPKCKNWKSKENELSQTTTTKDIKYFPRVKGYYVLLAISLVIIKFGNETFKETINGKLHGFYNNSGKYLYENFHLDISTGLNWAYIFKALPYFLLLLSVTWLLISLGLEFKENRRLPKKNQLNIGGVLGKHFYWISGEKLESNSTETVKSEEPSNLKFRSFLLNIDKELIKKNKVLLLTIDNTDRLTDIKLKNIWSTINIFFADNNNNELLQNIWLIIPYDKDRVINSFGPEIGEGLLEKTLSIKFSVPPPLLSNWELFFDLCFERSFKNTSINNKSSEVELLKRIFEHYQKEITPRGIINFINELATYYIQHKDIALRYFAIVIFNKKLFYKSSINDNIINRHGYLGGLNTLFEDDEKLELSISKIAYGLSKDSEAEEALLSNVLKNTLYNNLRFDEETLKTPSFTGYFYSYFKNVFSLSNFLNGRDRKVFFHDIAILLLSLQEFYSKKHLYRSLWEHFLSIIGNEELNVFNETHEGVLLFCSRHNKITFINYFLDSYVHTLSRETPMTKENRKKVEDDYIIFLTSLEGFIIKNKLLTLKDFQIKEIEIQPETCLNLIKSSSERYANFKVKCNDQSLKIFLIDDNFYSSEYKKNLAIKYRKEIVVLKERTNLDFLVDELNLKWQHRQYNHLEQVNTLIYYYQNLKNISLKNHSPNGFISLHDLALNSTSESDLIKMVSLIFINYANGFNNSSLSSLNKVLKMLEERHISKIIKKIIELNYSNSLINSFSMCLSVKELDFLKAFSNELINKNKLKPDDDGFKWLLINYSFALNLLEGENKNKLYTLLNKSTKDIDIDIETIDVELINESNYLLNKKLIVKGNEYLSVKLIENQAFFNANNSKTHDVFYKLFEIKKVSTENYDRLHKSLISLVISNTAIPQTLENKIIEIKKEFNSRNLTKLIQAHLSRLNSKRNIYILAPEIFELFQKLNPRTKNTLISVAVQKPRFYSKKLVDCTITLNNIHYLATLKVNLQSIEDEEILEYARDKGLIS